MTTKKKGNEPRRIGAQGWQEFLTSKHELLYAYRLALFQDKNRPIHTERGNVAESVYRRWLKGFLPARYGVTSGYIISAGYSDRVPPRHYDVIIYDKLEAPVLWHENNADRNEDGRVRAIPAEYVLHVTEVKSTLNKSSVIEARDKLLELKPLYGKLDRDRLIYLPVQFGASVVFFEADKSAKRRDLYPLTQIKADFGGFMGGIILSSPDGNENKSIQFMPNVNNEPLECQSPDEGVDSFYGILAPTPHEKVGNGYPYLMLDYMEASFANYAHGIIRRMKRDFDTNTVASWHGQSYGPFPADEDLSSLFPLDAFAPKPKTKRKKSK